MKLALRRIPFVLMVAIGGSYVLLRAILPILSSFHEIGRASCRERVCLYV